MQGDNYYDKLLNLKVKHESDFTLERFKLKQERKKEEEHSSAKLVPDISDNSSKGPWTLNANEMEDFDITIKEERDGISIEDSLIQYATALEHLECKSQNNHEILIKEEIADTDYNKEVTDDISNGAEPYYSIKQEDYDITIKEEWDGISIEDSLIEYGTALEHLDCKNQVKKKDDLKGQLMLNICRDTKYSHNGKENNSFLHESNNYEFAKKTKSYEATTGKFRCNKCAKSFKSKSHLNRHEKIHLRMSGELLKIFNCRLCGAQFSRNDTLTRHTLNVHCEIKQKFHACPLCGKCFRSACSVSRHSVVHDKQARHPCDSCGSSFSQQGDLRRHQVYAHGSEPPSRTHVCSICGKAYAKRTILLRHKASHIRERLLICEICGREFTRKDCLFSHIKNKHII